jgi:predicted unusual protein kinase regulating ubiquinone biosynthesis (AarF/ABC1/UbiB family)
MLAQQGPSRLALLQRAAVSLDLIARAALVYLRVVLHNRGIWRADPAHLVEMQHRFARRFVRVATRFKGGLIKLGQVASLRIDVMPPEVTEELSRLQDRVEAHPYGEIAAQVEAELGAPISELFDDFSAVPIASASLGQVHRARARDGEEVAVKVLYPGVERSVAVDLAMTKFALWFFNFLTVADLMQVYQELREALLGEMDYVREGRAAEEIALNLARDPEVASRVLIPTIRWGTTTRRVLTMQFLEGVRINDRAALAAQGRDLSNLVLWTSRAFLHMMFRDGFFHCDPHPGNLLVDAEGRIIIVDFGMNKRVAAELRAAIRKNVIASVQRDPDLYAASLLEAGIVRECDLPAVKEIAKLSFDPEYFNLTPKEVANLDFAEYFGRMRAQMKRIQSFQLPDGLVMWSRAFSLLYALATELAPGLRPLDVIGPYVLEFLQGEPAARLA